MQNKRKRAAEETANKQGARKSSARKIPSVTKGSVNPDADRHKRRLLIICLFLVIAAFMAFWQVTQSDFINLDDANYVTGNGHVQDGLTVEGILWAFTTGHAGYWHPLTWISHMVDVQLFGLRPGWHHLTNLLFHLASTLLLFFGLHRMTKALWQSAFVAALFALHPLHVESVAWIAERKDVLSTFFWMLTVGMYVSYVARPGLTRYLTLLLCFALGLMAKPMLVTLPFVLLLLDYWPLQRMEQKKPPQEVPRLLSKGKKTAPVKASVYPVDHRPLIQQLLIEKIPLFALTLLFSIVTYLAQRHGGALSSIDALPPSGRMANAFISYSIYVIKMLWPTNLAVFYPHPTWWPLWQVLGSVVLLIAITLFVIRGAKKRPYAAVGWLWYVGTLVPVIGVVQVGAQALADRFTYIPLVGLFIIVAWAVPELLKKWPYRKEALIALSALCLICLFLVTWRQVGYWRNSIALYDHTLEVTDRNSLIHNSRGVAYTNLAKYTQAIADFDKAIEINPRYGEASYNRGVAYKSLGKYTQAIADFNRAIEVNRRPGEAYNSRGMVHGLAGNYTQAIADFNKAIEINPRYGEAWYNRGVTYGLAGNYTQTIADLNRAIEINPRYGDAYSKRGVAYGLAGNYTQAIADLNRAIEINPGNGEAWYNRGTVYGTLGNRERAIDDIRTAARLGHEGARSFLRSQG
jgi:protein O-mannosyl-transferase